MTPGLEGLEGATYGPYRYEVDLEKVHEYVVATGDDPDRWTDTAPPGFVACPLFVVAPALLSDPRVIETGAVIHGDQRFQWHRPLEVGTVGEVGGEVTRVRRRGDATFVGFHMEWTAGDGPIAQGSSMFVVVQSGAAGGQPTVAEPAPDEKADGARSASRVDLVRYAGATRDWNPIHWDHESAVAAGLGGIVVHGLLQTAWMIQEAVGPSPIEDRNDPYSPLPASTPLRTARFRFREPLRPATAVTITGESGRYQLESSLGIHLVGEFT